MRFRHPSKKTLREWLAGEGSSEIDAHLDTCQRCSETLEQLDGSDDLDIGDALAAILAPPSDLSDRLERRVAARLDSRMMFGVVTDLSLIHI